MHSHEQHIRNDEAKLHAKLEHGHLRLRPNRCNGVSEGQSRPVSVFLHRRLQTRLHRVAKHLRVSLYTSSRRVSGAFQNGLHGNEEEVRSARINHNYPHPNESRLQLISCSKVTGDLFSPTSTEWPFNEIPGRDAKTDIIRILTTAEMDVPLTNASSYIKS